MLKMMSIIAKIARKTPMKNFIITSVKTKCHLNSKSWEVLILSKKESGVNTLNSKSKWVDNMLLKMKDNGFKENTRRNLVQQLLTIELHVRRNLRQKMKNSLSQSTQLSEVLTSSM